MGSEVSGCKKLKLLYIYIIINITDRMRIPQQKYHVSKGTGFCSPTVVSIGLALFYIVLG